MKWLIAILSVNMRLSLIAALCLVLLVQYNDALSKVKTDAEGLLCPGAWKLVFVGVARNGKSVYDRWHQKHNHNCCEVKRGCLPERTRHHFFLGFRPKQHLRSPLIDEWKTLNIRQVKVELYTNGERTAYLTFNGYKSSMSNWFARGRLLTSSFSDLYRGTPTNFFSFSGHKYRKMYVSRNHGGCSVDQGWFAILENNSGCRWDTYRRPYPQFIFGNGRIARWYSNRFLSAEFMTVWIKQN